MAGKWTKDTIEITPPNGAMRTSGPGRMSGAAGVNGAAGARDSSRAAGHAASGKDGARSGMRSDSKGAGGRTPNRRAGTGGGRPGVSGGAHSSAGTKAKTTGKSAAGRTSASRPASGNAAANRSAAGRTRAAASATGRAAAGKARTANPAAGQTRAARSAAGKAHAGGHKKKHPKKKQKKQRRQRRGNGKRKFLLWLMVLVIVAMGGLILRSCMLTVDVSKLEYPSYIQQDFIAQDGHSRTGWEMKKVNDIVIHYVANPGSTAKGNRDYFDSDQSRVSAHFVVGLEGEVIQCIPLDEQSSASNERNPDTISIEVCHPDSSGKFNDRTTGALVELTAWLCREFHLDEDNLIRHYDITGKDCPKYFVEHPDAWEEFKREVKRAM